MKWAQPAARRSPGAWGSLPKALRLNELAAIREAKNALAVEGAPIGLAGLLRTPMA